MAASRLCRLLSIPFAQLSKLQAIAPSPEGLESVKNGRLLNKSLHLNYRQ